jgi:O-acetyl-ADP-ribose deacetylase (regulator of RNase III)
MIVFEGDRNIFESDMQTITCTINVVGVMGKGIALEFRKRYPALFDVYRQHFPYHKNIATTDIDNKLIHTLITHPISSSQQALLFPTKKHWYPSSKLEWIEDNLKILAQQYEILGITSLALPLLGCGNGGLQYRDVQPLIYEHLDPLPIPVELSTF